MAMNPGIDVNVNGIVLCRGVPGLRYAPSGLRSTATTLPTQADSRGNKKLSYAWSPGGLLNRLTDSDGRLTAYQYDPAGRLSAILAPNHDRIAFAWDAGSRLSEKWFPNGLSARYTYNPDNSLKHLTNRSAATTVLTQHDYSYDGAGNRIRQIEKIDAVTTPYDYAYDPLNRPIQVKNGNAAQQEDYVRFVRQK